MISSGTGSGLYCRIWRTFFIPAVTSWALSILAIEAVPFVDIPALYHSGDRTAVFRIASPGPVARSEICATIALRGRMRSNRKETRMTASTRRTVGILIFDDVEVLDFCGPFEAFSVARPHGETSDESRLFKVVTIAETNEIVSCRGGLLVQPHHTIHDHPPLDIIVIPG